MTLEDFASRLEKAKPKLRAQLPTYTACCPAHDDKSPSFAVWEENGWLHVKCLTGCSESDILNSMGLTEDDRRVTPRETAEARTQSPQPRQQVATYWYEDFDGTKLFEKIKYLMGDGKKTFAQRLPTGEWGVGSLNGKAKIFYRLPQLIQAIREGRMIYVNEGEKACDRIAKEGLCATCQPGGAAKDSIGSKWLPEHTAILKGANVVIVADRGDVGEIYSKWVAGQLQGVATSVRVVQSKTLNAEDDGFDHFEAGFTEDDFIERPDLVPERFHKAFEAKLVEEYEILKPDYLWDPYLRTSQINLLDARGGTGKTTFCVALAMQGSLGYLPWHGDCEPFKTLYFGTEDEGGEIHFLYRNLGGRPGFLHVFDQAFSLTPENLESVHDTILKFGAKFVIFDALAYYLSGTVGNAMDNMELSGHFGRLRNVARETKSCLLDLRHFAKDSKGVEASKKGSGPEQWYNSHRSQIVLQPHPNQKDFPRLTIATHEKASLNSPKGEHFGFQTKDGEFNWVPGSQIDLSVFEKDEPKLAPGKKPGRTIEYALEWLGDELLGMGEQASNNLFEKWAQIGGSRDMLFEAKRQLGIKAMPVHDGGHGAKVWVWFFDEPEVPSNTGMPWDK